MSRSASFFVFFGVALSLTAGLHYYIWARLVRDPGLPPLAFRLLTALVILLCASIPLTLWLYRMRPLENMRPLLLGMFGWMGLMFFTVVLLGIGDVGRLFARLLQNGDPVDPARRLAVSRMFGAGVALVATSLGAVATHQGLTRLTVRRAKVRLPRLPKALDGFKLVQLSDIHVGPTILRDFIERVVATTNALEPDAIVITGDLVDGSVEQLREHVAPLAGLRARHGVYFVTGNHEYYSGAEDWCDELTRLGVRVLRNERVTLGNDDASFDLAGVDDSSAHRFGRGHGADLPKAVLGRDPARELVLLAHQPRAVFEAKDQGVGLMLSGHTHGGQMWPWNWLVRLQQPVVSGFETFERTLVWVSNGTGYWGPPMRLGAPAEITELVLSSGELSGEVVAVEDADSFPHDSVG